MSLDGYQLRSQLGAGHDGTAYRAIAADGATAVLVLDLARARADSARWARLVPRLRLAAQLAHASALAVIELSLDQAAPCVVLEWQGETTLATAASTRLPASERAAADLLRPLAAALAEAHRLGLAHGRISPEHVFLTTAGAVKLDFTGASAGFPREPNRERAPSASELIESTGNLTHPRAADLYGLGALIDWLDRNSGEAEAAQHHRKTTSADSPLARLAQALMIEEPSERLSAQEALARLDRVARPMDATGDWTEPDDRSRPGNTLSLDTDFRQAMALASPPQRQRGHETTGSLGRYRLLEKLGEGGQGVVYRALDPTNESVVAIKVLRSDRAGNEQVLRRFRKEARLMIEANNPYVVNLLDQNEHEGIPYLVLEFVAGTNLGQLLEQKSRLDVPEALRIMTEVARGLTHAHEREIVHRDIKPGNILLVDHVAASAVSLAETIQVDLSVSPGGGREPQFPASSNALAVTLSDGENGDPRGARVKITDFGLARHVVDSESLAMTDAGALVGTPYYMAPEQWTGRGVDPRTDVYAMGATLYHLLAGKPPFTGQTRDLLCQQHCNDQPPSLALLNPDVSEGLARAVERALSKNPDDRFPDAAAMLRDLEALRLGKPTDLAIHPRLPECDPSRLLQFEFRWELEASPRELWPLVTNTDRLDRALGFSPVTYQTRFEPGRGVRTFAEGRKAGMPEVGEEYPYEWVEPRRMGILRQYSRGPFKWLVSSVELLPRPRGGTTLIHSLRLEPSTWTIRLGSRWGVGVGMRKSLEKVYRRIDATLKGQRSRGLSRSVDPFEEAAAMPAQVRSAWSCSWTV